MVTRYIYIESTIILVAIFKKFTSLHRRCWWTSCIPIGSSSVICGSLNTFGQCFANIAADPVQLASGARKIIKAVLSTHLSANTERCNEMFRRRSVILFSCAQNWCILKNFLLNLIKSRLKSR